MNRSQTKLLVESWRDFMGMSKDENESGKSLGSVDQEFFDLVVDYKNSSKEWDPNDQGAGNSQKVRSNEIYQSLWESFWSAFNTKRFPESKDWCVTYFFQNLHEVFYKSNEGKKIFRRAFKILLSTKSPNAGVHLVHTVFEMLFNDYMHNMRGSDEGYCWQTDEEGRQNFEEFKLQLKHEKGFRLEDFGFKPEDFI